MGDSCIEVLVKKKPKSWYSFVKGLLVFSTIWVFAVLGLMRISILFIILGALLGVATYFIFMELDLEYEYLYLNGEITIDKIMGKSSRKPCMSLTIDNVEIAAPINSWHLSEYKNRKAVVEQDFSSGDDNADVYVVYYNGKKGFSKLLFEPGDKMVEYMHQLAPRRVFSE